MILLLTLILVSYTVQADEIKLPKKGPAECVENPLDKVTKKVNETANDVEDVTGKDLNGPSDEEKIKKCLNLVYPESSTDSNENQSNKAPAPKAEVSEQTGTLPEKVKKEYGQVSSLDQAESEECKQYLEKEKEKSKQLEETINFYEEEKNKKLELAESEEERKKIEEEYKQIKEFAEGQNIQPQFDKGQYEDLGGGNFKFKGSPGSGPDGSRNGGAYDPSWGGALNFKDYPSEEANAALKIEGEEVKKDLEKASEAVGKFSNGSANCTAQIVGGKEGQPSYVMTNHHCLQNGALPNGATVQFDYDNDGKNDEVTIKCSEVVTKSSELDMALVKCEPPPRDRGKIALATKKEMKEALEKEKQIYSFTHESGKRTQFTEGKVKAVQNGVVTTNASAREGSSGSVALSTIKEGDKKVVKATTLRNKRGPVGQRISFEIPMGDIVEHLCKELDDTSFDSIMDGGKSKSCSSQK